MTIRSLCAVRDALLTLSGLASEHREHVETALPGSKSDPLLARNPSSHFLADQGETVAQLLIKPAAARETKP